MMRTKHARTVSILASMSESFLTQRQAARLVIANMTAPSSATSPLILSVVSAVTQATWPGTAQTDSAEPIGVTMRQEVRPVAQLAGLGEAMLSIGNTRYVKSPNLRGSMLTNHVATYARAFWWQWRRCWQWRSATTH